MVPDIFENISIWGTAITGRRLTFNANVEQATQKSNRFGQRMWYFFVITKNGNDCLLAVFPFMFFIEADFPTSVKRCRASASDNSESLAAEEKKGRY